MIWSTLANCAWLSANALIDDFAPATIPAKAIPHDTAIV